MTANNIEVKTVRKKKIQKIHVEKLNILKHFLHRPALRKIEKYAFTQVLQYDFTH